MKDGLYNEQVYMPKLNIRDVDVQLRYTYHAIEQADCKGIENLPDYINLSGSTIVEMEVRNGKVMKVLARQAYDFKSDITFVILVRDMTVKTVWLNGKDDTHRTLDASKYIKE